MHFTGKAGEAEIAGTALEIDIAFDALDSLVAAAGVGADGGILWNRDVIIDGNIIQVHIVNADTVAVLANRGIILQLLDFSFVVAAEAGIPGVNFGVNGHRAGAAVAHGNIA